MKINFFNIILLIIVILGFSLRLISINSPIADWHSWRQSDTAAVARNFLRFGIDPLRPRYDDLSNIQTGFDNPSGWRMVEFPVYQLISVFIYDFFNFSSIEVSLRFVSILASVGTIISLALLLKRWGSKVAALAAAGFFAVLPYSIFYGRSILPESLMVFFSVFACLLAFMAFDRKNFLREFLIILSAISASLALLTKPTSLFILFPLAVPFLINFRLSIYYFLRIIVFGLIIGIPIFLWRKWILQYPEGIASYTWLFNEGNLRFKPAWIRWIFIERIGKLIFGVWGSVFLSLGIIAKKKNEEFFTFWMFIAGMLTYITIIARGNVQHDYYQVLILPVLSIVAGYGFSLLIKGNNLINSILGLFTTFIILSLALFSSWFDVRGYYWINRPEIIEAGKMANLILPKDAKVIAPYNGDTSFLYQINRQGWPIGFEIEKKISQGATHYVTVSAGDNDGETKDLAKRYTVIIRNEKFAIIDLTKPVSN